jgi:hypothetical protein
MHKHVGYGMLFESQKIEDIPEELEIVVRQIGYKPNFFAIDHNEIMYYVHSHDGAHCACALFQLINGVWRMIEHNDKIVHTIILYGLSEFAHESLKG